MKLSFLSWTSPTLRISYLNYLSIYLFQDEMIEHNCVRELRAQVKDQSEKLNKFQQVC